MFTLKTKTKSILILAFILFMAIQTAAEGSVFETLLEKSTKQFKEEEYKSALSHINYALRLNGKSRKAQILKAEILLAMGDKDGCNKILKPILKWAPKNRDAVRVYLKANPPVQPRWFEHKRMISKLHRRWKSNVKKMKVLTAEDYRRLAKNSVESGLFGTAERYMKSAMRIEPHNIKNRMLLADAMTRNGKHYSAAQEYDRIISLVEENWKFYYHAGSLYRKADQLELAMMRFQSALKLKPDDPALVEELISVSKTLKKEDLYMTLLAEKVGTVLKEARFYRYRASAYIRKMKWVEAASDLRHVKDEMKFNETGEMYLLELVDFLARGGGEFKFIDRPLTMSKTMLDDLREIFRLEGDIVFNGVRGRGSKKNMARFLSKLKFNNDAIRILNKLVKEEEDAESYYIMAKIYEKMNKAEDLEMSLNSGKLVDETYIPVRNWLGRIYLNRENFERANYEFDAVLKINKRNIDALLGMAEINYEINDLVSLKEIVKKIKKIDPSNKKVKRFMNKF